MYEAMEAQQQEGAVQEGTSVMLAERLQMRGAPFFPLPPVEGEKRRISEACAKVDSYMYEKRQTSVPDLHQVAEGESLSRGGRDQPSTGHGRPGSGRGRPGSGRSRPGSGRSRPGSGRGRPGSGHGQPRSGHGRPGSGHGQPRSGHGLHTPGGGNVKIFSAQLPDFSHIQSRVDSGPTPKESDRSQRKSIGCSAELAKGTPLGSSHSKFNDHSYSKESVISPLRKNGLGEVTSAPTRRNKSSSELSGRNKSSSELSGRNKSTSELSGRNRRPTGGERLLGTHNGRRRKHSSDRLDGRPGLPAPLQGGVPSTHSDTMVGQELKAIRRHAQPKVDTGKLVPTYKDLFCSVAELTDRKSFSVNVRFLLRPQLVAAIFKRRRSFSEVDASATLDRRKARDVDCRSLKRSKSLSDLHTTTRVPAEDSLAPDRASTLPRTWQPRGREEDSLIPSFFCGKVMHSEKCVEGSEGTDLEKEEVDCVERKMGGSHMWGCHGDEAGSCPHHSPGAGHPRPTSVSDRGRSVLTTPIKKTKADASASAVNCTRSPHQLKMALPLSLRRYT